MDSARLMASQIIDKTVGECEPSNKFEYVTVLTHFLWLYAQVAETSDLRQKSAQNSVKSEAFEQIRHLVAASRNQGMDGFLILLSDSGMSGTYLRVTREWSEKFAQLHAKKEMTAQDALWLGNLRTNYSFLWSYVLGNDHNTVVYRLYCICFANAKSHALAQFTRRIKLLRQAHQTV